MSSPTEKLFLTVGVRLPSDVATSVWDMICKTEDYVKTEEALAAQKVVFISGNDDIRGYILLPYGDVPYGDHAQCDKYVKVESVPEHASLPMTDDAQKAVQELMDTLCKSLSVPTQSVDASWFYGFSQYDRAC